MVLAALISLYGLIDFLEKVDDFIEHGARAHSLCPFSFVQPAADPFEHTADGHSAWHIRNNRRIIKDQPADGSVGKRVSFVQISRPLFVCGLFLSCVAFFSNAWLLPLANSEANYLIKTELKGSDPLIIKEKTSICVTLTKYLNWHTAFPEKGEIFGVSLFKFDHDFAYEPTH